MKWLFFIAVFICVSFLIGCSGNIKENQKIFFNDSYNSYSYDSIDFENLLVKTGYIQELNESSSIIDIEKVFKDTDRINVLISFKKFEFNGGSKQEIFELFQEINFPLDGEKQYGSSYIILYKVSKAEFYAKYQVVIDCSKNETISHININKYKEQYTEEQKEIISKFVFVDCGINVFYDPEYIPSELTKTGYVITEVYFEYDVDKMTKEQTNDKNEELFNELRISDYESYSFFEDRIGFIVRYSSIVISGFDVYDKVYQKPLSDEKFKVMIIKRG